MLTKQEREEIAERVKNYTMASPSIYECLLGSPLPKSTDTLQGCQAMAARILELCDTSNMLELPVDKDGVPFKRGDTVYESDGTEHIVDGYAFSRANAKILSVVDLINNSRVLFETDELTHKRPVTIASVREQLKHVLDKGEMTSWSMARLFDITEQLEKLGESDD